MSRRFQIRQNLRSSNDFQKYLGLFLVLSKDDSNISVSFIQIQNFVVSNMAMVKVDGESSKVNVAVTDLGGSSCSTEQL